MFIFCPTCWIDESYYECPKNVAVVCRNQLRIRFLISFVWGNIDTKYTRKLIKLMLFLPKLCLLGNEINTLKLEQYGYVQ